jgi:hypothetical protein
MNALARMIKAGFDINLVDGFIEIHPASSLNMQQREFVKLHKAEIMAQLSIIKAAKTNELLQDIQEQIEERAAIMEFDGGLSRHDAVQAAIRAIRVYCYRVTDKPDRELTVIMPNTELDEAVEKLKVKYGDRLLDVYTSPYCMTGVIANSTKH